MGLLLRDTEPETAVNDAAFFFLLLKAGRGWTASRAGTSLVK